MSPGNDATLKLIMLKAKMTVDGVNTTSNWAIGKLITQDGHKPASKPDQSLSIATLQLTLYDVFV